MRLISKLVLLVVIIMSAMAVTTGMRALAQIDPKVQVCAGVNAVTGGSADCTTDDGKVGNTMKAIVNVLSWVVGIISVIMVIIGGFKYVTSGGNDSSVSSAKNTILYAVVGLVIVALAQVIVRFVLTKV